MSHKWDCPTDWEARREGRLAGERGYGRNPYDDPFPGPFHSHCEEAADNWERGEREGRYAREEREREEEQRLADDRRRYEQEKQSRADVEYLYEQQQQQEEGESPEPPEGEQSA